MKRNRLVLGRVKDLLERFPELRDDDRKLMVTIWKEDLVANYVPGTFSQVFLAKDKDGRYIITSPESIRRSRQSIQEKHPELRGQLDIEREEEIPVWQEELGYPVQSEIQRKEAL